MNFLVVDDETAVARYLRAVVRSRGHNATALGDAPSALKAIDADGAIDFVISDVTLGGMDGFELAEQVAVKLNDGFPHTLLISGLPHGDEMRKVPPSVAMGLVSKPFSFLQLLNILDMMEKVRSTCPGLFLRGLTADSGRPTTGTRDGACRDYQNSGYGACPCYDTECGWLLRQWFASL